MRSARLVLVVGFIALAAYLTHIFLGIPSELVTECKSLYKPDGAGVATLAILSGAAAIACAFMPDWS
jgi:hypothetical protein